jgi:hypothetical protein
LYLRMISGPSGERYWICQNSTHAPTLHELDLPEAKVDPGLIFLDAFMA